MLALSFGWTWPAFVAGEKDTTRRTWKDDHAKKFKWAFKKSRPIQAWNQAPYAHGKPIGVVKLVMEPVKEPLAQMPDEDYRREGFKFFLDHPGLLPASAKKRPWAPCTMEAFDIWRNGGGESWTVRFKAITIYPEALEDLKKIQNKFRSA